MEKQVKLNVNGVSITLTKEQLDDIDKQRKNLPLFDRINSIEDALSYLKDNDEDVIDYKKMVSAGLSNAIIARQEVILMIKVLNEDWEADYSDENQKKWFPVFKCNSGSSSLVFSGSYYGIWFTSTYGGSRLALKSEELSDKFGKKFANKYQQFLIK